MCAANPALSHGPVGPVASSRGDRLRSPPLPEQPVSAPRTQAGRRTRAAPSASASTQSSWSVSLPARRIAFPIITVGTHKCLRTDDNSAIPTSPVGSRRLWTCQAGTTLGIPAMSCRRLAPPCRRGSGARDRAGVSGCTKAAAPIGGDRGRRDRPRLLPLPPAPTRARAPPRRRCLAGCVAGCLAGRDERAAVHARHRQAQGLQHAVFLKNAGLAGGALRSYVASPRPRAPRSWSDRRDHAAHAAVGFAGGEAPGAQEALKGCPEGQQPRSVVGQNVTLLSKFRKELASGRCAQPAAKPRWPCSPTWSARRPTDAQGQGSRALGGPARS